MERGEGFVSFTFDLVIMAESMDELVARLSVWKTGFESKGLRVNMTKTKILTSRCDTYTKQEPVRWPCSVCQKGVGSNSIFCKFCMRWIHERCSGIPGKLKPDPTFECKTCSGSTPHQVPHITAVPVGNDSREVVDSFCYLGDMSGQSGGCSDAITARVRSA